MGRLPFVDTRATPEKNKISYHILGITSGTGRAPGRLERQNEGGDTERPPTRT